MVTIQTTRSPNLFQKHYARKIEDFHRLAELESSPKPQDSRKNFKKSENFPNFQDFEKINFARVRIESRF
jgi:hypothetical protein